MATGTVEQFDEEAGWGVVRSAGGAPHFFHCIAVADGSRTIAEGTDVRFRVVAGHLGRWEADDIEAR